MAQERTREEAGDYHAKRTRDHETIRHWAESRNGHPAMVDQTEILRIDFDEPEQKLKRVSWDDFFHAFDHRDLEFLFQEHTQDGKLSRFNKFVHVGSDAG